ncbi:IclR family transcriptional regulator [Amycolatopsis taiwanensis]|nr:IclR family transcriptional regulator [Amycolatopsis taiwanensis]
MTDGNLSPGATQIGDPGGKSDAGVRSIGRAVSILELFDAEHPSRTLREIVSLTGLPKTTVVRVLATLETLDLVADKGESTYGLGTGFLRWVDLARSLWEVSADVRRVMAELVDACGETVNIYVRRDRSRISIAQVEGSSTVRSVVKVGVPYSLMTGAGAKILLSGTPEPVLRALLAQRSDADSEAFRCEVLSINEVGYAVTHGERELGASAVAAPIHGADGRVIAALSASGPTSRFTADRVGTLVDQVTSAAARIEQLGLGNVEAFL